MERPLNDLDLVAILIDGVNFDEQLLAVSLSLRADGSKRVLGLWQGATDNTQVCSTTMTLPHRVVLPQRGILPRQVALLGRRFRTASGGVAPAAPFPACGTSGLASDQELGCVETACP
jgi:hypothetical protein